VDNNDVLKTTNVRTHFFIQEGVVKAVDDVSLRIRKGEYRNNPLEGSTRKSIIL